MSDNDKTIHFLKLIKTEISAITPEQRHDALAELTCVALMCLQSVAEKEFVEGILEQAKKTPAFFKIDFDNQDDC